jgi:hypothetical protein
MVLSLSGLSSWPAVSAAEESWLDLSRAVVVAPEGRKGPAAKAVETLVEEVEKRTQIRWPVVSSIPEAGSGQVPIVLGTQAEVEGMVGQTGHEIPKEAGSGAEKADGYQIRAGSDPSGVVVAGNDPRGVLFGAGRLLRALRMSRGKVLLPAAFREASAPKVALRGHQLGYRPKTNSYDGWDLAQWEQYIRELAIFGTNAVELIPPRSDDDADSPHFPAPPLETMVGMSKILDDYGLDVWVWYPAMDPNYDDPATVDRELKAWDEVFRKLPRLDAVFVPGGDPGHTAPRVLLPFLEKVAEVLHRSHPKAQLWMSPQGFTQDWLDEFLEMLKEEPSWLSGVVHGPQIRIGLAELRDRVPARYPIRTYPDITHSQQCQFPVPDWDFAFSATESREVINPRPQGQATIFRNQQPHVVGFLSYSEGCNDDVNKFVWSGLGWDPDADVVDILRDYARFFIGEAQAEGFAQGLLALERNWQGPLLSNPAVEMTLQQFQDLERAATPATLLNWRFQQALYRAYYDAAVRERLIRETAAEATAIAALGQAEKVGSLNALEQAEQALTGSVRENGASRLRARVFELGEALFQSIRMQLSVSRYQAIGVDRGANLDTIDEPLNDRVWLTGQFAEIRKLAREPERLKAIHNLLHRTDPGPGGFYDDLGNLARQPHLVRGPGFEKDPDFRRSSIVGFGSRPGWPLAWCQNAQVLYDRPLRLHYEGLDPTAHYRVRIVYAGDSFRLKTQLGTEEGLVHDWLKKPDPPQPVEFDVPIEATRDGNLTLSWTVEPWVGGNGRSCQVAEVWLLVSEKP